MSRVLSGVLAAHCFVRAACAVVADTAYSAELWQQQSGDRRQVYAQCRQRGRGIQAVGRTSQRRSAT